MNMAAGALVEEDMDIGLYGDELEEPALPRKKVILHIQSGLVFFGVLVDFGISHVWQRLCDRIQER
jgi:hypothetical protein